ncbi:MAG: TIGR00282 family metallophosphoesterase [Clostridia bacterium]|nr:TIGR00282 family metallophosphoesterase [Clostridia bacterium]
MRILILGDIVSDIGCEHIREKLPGLKKSENIDFCIANGENSASGNGITPFSAQYLFDSGVDIITTGNHVYRRRVIYNFLDERLDIVRPANYYEYNPGRGYAVADLGRVKIGVINLAGTYAMDSVDNPFRVVEKVLDNIRDCKIKIVDFHAEATSEKRAMGFFLDGKVTCVFGTHTHVQTADEQILPHGTAYITDVGMCGVKDSVLGVEKNIIVKKYYDSMPALFDAASGECMINGLVIDVENSSGKVTEIKRINL